MTPQTPLKKVYKRFVPTGSRRQGVVIFTILMGRYYRKNGGRGLGGYIRRELRHRYYARPEIYEPWIRRNNATSETLDAQRAQGASGGPLISILTPVYNPPPAVLRETILSVLAQTYPHWQLCLADGASTDPGVRVVLEEFAATDSRIRVVFLPENLGISGNSNAALAAAEGEFVALLDHDDLLTPNHLHEVTQTLRAHPEADVIYFDEDKISADGTRRTAPYFKPRRFSAHSLTYSNYLMHSALRRRLVNEAGGFDPETDGAQDWDLAFRVTEQTAQIYHIPKVLYHWRQLSGSTSVEPLAKPYALQAQTRSLENHRRRTAASSRKSQFLLPAAAGMLLLTVCFLLAGARKSKARREPSLSWELPEGNSPLIGAADTAMRISVALCTYNGASYLAEQLGSIRAQTRLPDELVVCDDGSTDSTLALLEAFRAAAPFAVSVHQNAVNLGSTANFEQAIRLCTGDIIALSDQDDVWLPEKLAKMAAQFDADPEIGLVFSDAEVVDDALQPLGLRLWEFARFGEERQALFQAGRAFESQLAHNVVTGATLAFRADLRALILPIPTDAYHIHDGWIALIASLVSRLAFLPERLVLYRQHTAQQLGVLHQERQRVLPGSHYRMHITLLQAVGERLSRHQDQTGADHRRRIAELAAHARHIQRRLDLPRSRVRRLPVVLQELLGGRYHRYSNGLPSLARDIFYPVEAS